jgi:hypothetical protein
MPVHRVTLPTSSGTVWSHTRKHINGKGAGSVLLDKGGVGSASSYLSLEDYVNQTGLDPTKNEPKVLGKGIAKSLASVNDKIEKLLIAIDKTAI